MNIIYVPISIYVFVFLVYIFPEYLFCLFRHTLWSYAISHNRKFSIKEQPLELLINWNNTKLSQGKGRLRLPVPSYHSNQKCLRLQSKPLQASKIPVSSNPNVRSYKNYHWIASLPSYSFWQAEISLYSMRYS